MRKIDKRKVYAFIGKTVIYGSMYIGSIAFAFWSLTKITVY